MAPTGAIPTVIAPAGNVGPSTWVLRWGPFAIASVRGSTGRTPEVLDLACGSGRHARWFAAQGCRVTAVDRDTTALQTLQDFAETVEADLEGGDWPLPQRRFDIVLITNYLWRPLWPHILSSVAAGGWLLYETFGVGQASIGKPSNPAFLLQPGELLEAVRGPLRAVAYEDGFADGPPRFVQRLAAVREASPTDGAPVRIPLAGA